MSSPIESNPVGIESRLQSKWICGPRVDVLMALSWVPFALLAIALQPIPGAQVTLMFAVFIFSFTHQPLTLVLVYGDASRFALRPGIFVWSPLVFGAAILLCMKISPLLLAAAAGLWNAEHTLMQRYGITRIYGRKVGQKDGGVELYMLFSWLILVLVWAAADPTLLDKVAALGFQGANRTSFELLAKLAPAAQMILPVAILGVAALLAAWLKQEFTRTANRAKRVYVFSTAMLFVVMLINPIAGFIGYVGAHAYEYFVIVNHNLSLQYQKPGDGGGRVGEWVRSSYGRIGFFVVYLALILFIFVARSFLPVFALAFITFIVGALHFFYDGFIWKLRIPSVAKGLGAG